MHKKISSTYSLLQLHSSQIISFSFSIPSLEFTSHFTVKYVLQIHFSAETILGLNPKEMYAVVFSPFFGLNGFKSHYKQIPPHISLFHTYTSVTNLVPRAFSLKTLGTRLFCHDCSLLKTQLRVTTATQYFSKLQNKRIPRLI